MTNVGDEITSEYARIAARTVYLECPEPVAADISRVIVILLSRAETAEAKLAAVMEAANNLLCRMDGHYANAEDMYCLNQALDSAKSSTPSSKLLPGEG